MAEQWRRFREKLRQCDPAGADLDGSEILPLVVGEATRWIRLDKLIALARGMSRPDTPPPAPQTPAFPPGAICATYGTGPSGWLACDGRRVACVEYPRLYGAIGDQFGKSDGGVTFALPEIRIKLTTVPKASDPIWVISP